MNRTNLPIHPQIDIGDIVTVRYILTGEIKTFRLGKKYNYNANTNEETLPFNAPLGSALFGRKIVPGEVFQIKVELPQQNKTIVHNIQLVNVLKPVKTIHPFIKRV